MTFCSNIPAMSKSTAEDIVRRATAAFNAGKPDEARALCEQGLRRAPDEPMLHHVLAAVLFAKGDVATARVHIEASLARQPDNAAARMLAARIARSAKDFGAALSHLDLSIATAPQREAFVEKARTLDQASAVQKQLRPQPREAWRAVLKAIPHHQEAAARLGRLAFEDGDHAEAIELLERAVASDAPASVWFDLGLVRQDLRDRGGAAAAYRKALDIKPDFPEAHVNLGLNLQHSGDLESAMDSYRQAVRLRPDSFGRIAQALTSAKKGQLWLNLGRLRRSLGA
jgi:tetratricopeptide (TPR) repeat protein